jgi:hypothetical protein
MWYALPRAQLRSNSRGSRPARWSAGATAARGKVDQGDDGSRPWSARSEDDLHAVFGPPRCRGASSARCGESSSRMGLVLLMWIRQLARARGRLSSHSSMPPGPDCGRWPMSRAGLAAEAQRDHLVVGPEGAVHQHAVGARMAASTAACARPGRARRRRCARWRVGERQADVVAVHRLLAVRRIGRRLAGQRQGARSARRARRRTPNSLPSSGMRWRRRRSSVPARAGSGLPLRQVFVHRVGAPQRQRRPRSRSMKRPVCGRPGRPSAARRRWRCRGGAPGCRRGVARICSRMSGEALNSTQSLARRRRARRSTTACAAWRARCPRARRRNCGNCSSTAESRRRRRAPRTWMRMSSVSASAVAPRARAQGDDRRRPALLACEAAQRAATYIVISKPKRKSQACGVVQVMLSPGGCAPRMRPSATVACRHGQRTRSRAALSHRAFGWKSAHDFHESAVC